MAIKHFEDLIAWQKAYALCLKIYKITQKFPQEEQYGLKAHIRKTALSCPSNIAEGYERRNKKEFNTFIRISLGSLGELKTQLFLSKDLNYITMKEFNELVLDIDKVRKITHGLRKSLKLDS